MKKYTATVLFFCILLLFAGITHAQPSSSGVRDIEAQNIYPGQSTNISIAITNTENQALSLQETISRRRTTISSSMLMSKLQGLLCL